LTFFSDDLGGTESEGAVVYVPNEFYNPPLDITLTDQVPLVAQKVFVSWSCGINFRKFEKMSNIIICDNRLIFFTGSGVVDHSIARTQNKSQTSFRHKV
jgi:hypothetical protein